VSGAPPRWVLYRRGTHHSTHRHRAQPCRCVAQVLAWTATGLTGLTGSYIEDSRDETRLIKLVLGSRRGSGLPCIRSRRAIGATVPAREPLTFAVLLHATACPNPGRVGCVGGEPEQLAPLRGGRPPRADGGKPPSAKGVAVSWSRASPSLPPSGQHSAAKPISNATVLHGAGGSTGQLYRPPPRPVGQRSGVAYPMQGTATLEALERAKMRPVGVGVGAGVCSQVCDSPPALHSPQ
jgi:hypothetical protein